MFPDSRNYFPEHLKHVLLFQLPFLALLLYLYIDPLELLGHLLEHGLFHVRPLLGTLSDGLVHRRYVLLEVPVHGLEGLLAHLRLPLDLHAHLLGLVGDELSQTGLCLLARSELVLDGLRDTGLHGVRLFFLCAQNFLSLFPLAIDLESHFAQLLFYYLVLFVADILLVFEALAERAEFRIESLILSLFLCGHSFLQVL